MSPISPAWVVGHKNIRLVSPITMINIHDPPTLYWVRWPTDWYLQKYRFLSRGKSIRRFIPLGVPSLLISYSSIISSLALCTSRDFMLFWDFLSYIISEHVHSCRGLLTYLSVPSSKSGISPLISQFLEADFQASTLPNKFCWGFGNGSLKMQLSSIMFWAFRRIANLTPVISPLRADSATSCSDDSLSEGCCVAIAGRPRFASFFGLVRKSGYPRLAVPSKM